MVCWLQGVAFLLMALPMHQFRRNQHTFQLVPTAGRLMQGERGYCLEAILLKVRNSSQALSNVCNQRHVGVTVRILSFPTVGEAEGWLWAAKAELSGAMEKMNGLMTKIDLGLKIIMDMGCGSSGPSSLKPCQSLPQTGIKSKKMSRIFLLSFVSRPFPITLVILFPLFEHNICLLLQ